MSETTLTAERVRANRAAGYWRNETVDTYLDRWARERPAKTAVVDAGGRLTWAELARTVERTAYGLAEHGIGAGSVVSCQLPNWTEFVVLALAATRLGAILNPIPPTYRGNELRFILNALETQALVIPQRFRSFDYVEMAAELRAHAPRLERVWVARGAPGPGMLPFGSLLETAWESRAGRRPLAGTDPNAVSEVIFT